MGLSSKRVVAAVLDVSRASFFESRRKIVVMLKAPPPSCTRGEMNLRVTRNILWPSWYLYLTTACWPCYSFRIELVISETTWHNKDVAIVCVHCKISSTFSWRNVLTGRNPASPDNDHFACVHRLIVMKILYAYGTQANFLYEKLLYRP